jgi:hypothetical protein
METTLISTNANQQEQDTFRTISLAALLTGILAISAAIVKFYIDTNRAATLKLTGTGEPVSFFTYLTQGGPDHLLKYIAGGVFGTEASNGGKLMIIWGAVFHFIIAFLFTAFLFLIYPKIIKWLKNKFIVAFIYGLFTWAIMNLAVVPLSKINEFPSNTGQAIINAFILVFMIGIPASLLADRHYSRKRTT